MNFVRNLCVCVCSADEHLAELMPIFEKIRAQDQVPCAFPIHMGAGGTVFVRCNSSRSVPLSPHVLHCHPTTHWVSSILSWINSRFATTTKNQLGRRRRSSSITAEQQQCNFNYYIFINFYIIIKLSLR